MKLVTEYSAQKAALSVSKQVENDPAVPAAEPGRGEGAGADGNAGNPSGGADGSNAPGGNAAVGYADAPGGYGADQPGAQPVLAEPEAPPAPDEVNNAGKTLSKAYFGYSAKCTVPRLPQATEPVTEILTEQDAQKFVLSSGQSYRRTELVGAACEVAETELNGAEVTPDQKFAVRLDENNRITRDGGRNFLVAPNVINAQATDPARVGTKVGDSVLISSGPGVSEATNRTFYNTVYRNGIGVRVLMENANGTCVDGATFSVHKAKTDVTFENAPYSERVGDKVAELDGENCDTDGYTADLPPGQLPPGAGQIAERLAAPGGAVALRRGGPGRHGEPAGCRAFGVLQERRPGAPRQEQLHRGRQAHPGSQRSRRRAATDRWHRRVGRGVDWPGDRRRGSVLGAPAAIGAPPQVV